MYLDVRLHLLFLILQTLVPLLLFLHSRLQVMKDLFQLLLPGEQADSHLLGLCEQLGLSVELLGQNVLLFYDLKKGTALKKMICLCWVFFFFFCYVKKDN